MLEKELWKSKVFRLCLKRTAVACTFAHDMGMAWNLVGDSGPRIRAPVIVASLTDELKSR